MLDARNVSARQGRKHILHDISFSAQPGQVSAIVGPSGAGKSTFLKAMTGDLAYSGSITLNGQDIAQARLADLARIRAVLSQSTPMAFPFTVIEVVRLGLINSPGQDHIAQSALARVGLTGFEGRFYQELSGGEQQRVQLARILAQVWRPLGDDGVPSWLFLDEPVSSLDIGHQLQVMRIVRDFASAGGGVVMVMHDLNLTAMSADKVLLLKDGRAIDQGNPSTVFRNDQLSHAYECDLFVNRTPSTYAFILPQSAAPS
ncbi:MAG: heme ABC transporter ATP-binding protein [Rhodobacteraceae bacterium]|nr:heme ABC transporter ATP-binding protein [Paracoccaceae bacterium]